MNKTDCSITKLCGCYVDSSKNKVLTLSETFLNLDDEEFYKYLDLSRKCLSGNVGNNLLQLEFPTQEEEPGGRQQFLMGLKESGLKNEELLERFYDLIIEHYDHAGNYLILLVHDVYDVPGRTLDGIDMEDASDEIYEYILSCICPVELSKPGLSYIPRRMLSRTGSGTGWSPCRIRAFSSRLSMTEALTSTASCTIPRIRRSFRRVLWTSSSAVPCLCPQATRKRRFRL